MSLQCLELPADFAPYLSRIKNMPQKATTVPKVYPKNETSAAYIDYQDDGFGELYADELSMLQQNSDIPSKVVVNRSLQVTVEVDSEEPGSLRPEVDGCSLVDSPITYSPVQSSDCSSTHHPVSATTLQFTRPVRVRRPPLHLIYYKAEFLFDTFQEEEYLE